MRKALPAIALSVVEKRASCCATALQTGVCPFAGVTTRATSEPYSVACARGGNDEPHGFAAAAHAKQTRSALRKRCQERFDTKERNSERLRSNDVERNS